MLFKESGNSSHREPLESKGGGNRLSQDYACSFEERARVFAAASVNRQAPECSSSTQRKGTEESQMCALKQRRWGCE